MTSKDLCLEDPALFQLAAGAKEPLERYLQGRCVLAEGDRVLSAEPAGEGNMNLTLRAQTEQRSLIVKQSRPWVERYPTIAAPWDRVLSEARFYSLTEAFATIAQRMPRLIEVDADSRVIVLEDLGEASDFTSLYAGEALDIDAAAILAGWLSDLHALVFDETVRGSLANREMRHLNHEHVFRFPLDPNNGLDLDAITPGLGEAAESLAKDSHYVDRVTALGQTYLCDGAALLHGDFFPGSWLRGAGGPAVIDPEFAFFGPPEFDVGVLLGHLHLSGQGGAAHAAVQSAYRLPPGFDWQLARAFAGVEIMRRLMGVAQLPLTIDLTQKQALLRRSRELVLADNG